VEPAPSLLDFLPPRTLSPASGHAVRGGGVSLDASALRERAFALAGWLESLAPKAVALHMDNGPDWVIVDLACQAAGICLVPLPTFFSAAQLRHVLESMPIDAVFTDRADLLAPLCAGRLCRGEELTVGNGRLLRLAPVAEPAALPQDSGKVTFTSGSTGRPKGVCLSNAQLLRQAQTLAETVGIEGPRHLCLLPLSTLLENVAGVYAPLQSGGEVIVPGLADIGFQGSSSIDPRRLLAQLDHERPHSIILTPQLLQLLVGAAEAGWTPPESLAFVAVGGARVPPGLVERAHALGIPAYEGYGLSECASVVSLNLPGAFRPGSCGRPLAGLAIDVVDGEIHISGNAMLGYAGEPESWGRASIATGDLGTLDSDGFLHIEGRRKYLLISSFGRNISPEWVESELLGDGSLADCVVFGDARPYCVALLCPRDESLGDAAIRRIVERCNEALPDYARVRAWHRLPQPLAATGGLLTDNGRPKRDAIGARYGETIEALYRAGAVADSFEHSAYARTA